MYPDPTPIFPDRFELGIFGMTSYDGILYVSSVGILANDTYTKLYRNDGNVAETIPVTPRTYQLLKDDIGGELYLSGGGLIDLNLID